MKDTTHGHPHPTDQCPECGSDTITEGGETVCSECGFVFDTPELQSSIEASQRSRVTDTAGDWNPKGTAVGGENMDAYGRTLSADARERAETLRRWQRRLRVRGAEENLSYAMRELDRMTAALGLPKSVRENAGVIYRRAADENLHHPRSIDAITAGALHVAAKMEHVSRSIAEIYRVARVDERENVVDASRAINSKLGLEVPPTTPKQYIPRFASNIGLSKDVERRARELIERGESQNIFVGRSPPKVAAAALYAAALRQGDRISQEEVADETETDQRSISKLYRKISGRD